MNGQVLEQTSEVLAKAIAAHGGLERWRSVRSVRAAVSLQGLLWTLKGRPQGLPSVTMEADTRTPALTITPFPTGEVSVGRFAAQQVRIEGAGPARELRDPRASFAGAVLRTPWTELQELYFTGYAFWNYFTTPFLLAHPGVEVRELGPHVEAGQTWSRLAARFPLEIPTHCAEQTFYFNDKGLLQRIDYTTDVAGGIASHYTFDHATFDGFVVPTLRRVVPRVNGVPQIHGPSAVLVSISDVSFAS